MGTRAIRFMAGAGAALGLAASLAGCSRQAAPTLAPETQAPLVAVQWHPEWDADGNPALGGARTVARPERI